MTERSLPHGWTWDGVVSCLEEHADLTASAREQGALRRARVIRSGAQLLRLVLVYVLSGLSLRGTAAWAEASGEASLSDVALLKRLRGCGPWLALLCSRLSETMDPEASCPETARRVVAVDATMVCSPGGRHKPYRLLHTVYDVAAQRFVTTELSDRHRAERLDVGRVEEGEIRLGDRVYGRYRDLAAVTTASADYVVRLSAKALKLEDRRGKAVRRAELCRQAGREGILDVPVVIKGAKGDPPLVARLVILPLPAEQAEAARRRMRKKSRQWGYTPSEDALATAGCLMLVTSLTTKACSAQDVLALYRRRWQVEIAFKRLKSLLDLERLRAFDPDLVSAWIHAVLLVALLIDLERPSPHREEPDSPPWQSDDPGHYPFGALSHSTAKS